MKRITSSIQQYIYRFFIGSLLLTLFNYIGAQTSNFIHYGVQQGLIQSQVQTITQGDEGYLWIGTMAGISRFDGHQFKNYTKDDELAEDWVTEAFKDQKGNIWFGHWGGGVTKFQSATNDFQNIRAEKYSQFKSITAIDQDHNGRLWFGTEGAGLFIYQPESQAYTKVAFAHMLNEQKIYDIFFVNKDMLWLATNNGLKILTLGKPTSKKQKSGLTLNLNTEETLLSQNIITCIEPIGDHTIWIGTQTDGLYIYNTSTQEITDHISTAQGINSDYIVSIYNGADQHVWVGTHNAGIIKFLNKNKVGQGFKTYTTKQGLSYNSINTIIQDREENLWIGTDIGIDQYKGERFLIYDETDGLISSVVWSLMEDNQGDLWIGTNRGATEVSFLGETEESKPINEFTVKNYTKKQGLGAKSVLSLYQDQQGYIWMGTGGGGVSRLDPSDNSVKVFTEKDNLADNVVFKITEGKKGNLWFATKNGVSKYSPKDNTFDTYTKADGLGGNKVYTVFKDSKGNLWFGILGGELTRYDGQKFVTYNKSDGIEHNFILCITEDNNGTLWFGAYGGGLYKYDGKTFKNYTQEDGLTSNTPYLLTCDKENNIWIGTSRGLDKFNLKNESIHHYSKQEGFLGIETNQNAVCNDNKGNLWFGTIMGAVKYNPSEDKKNKVAPLTHITDISLYRKETKWQEYSDTINPKTGLPFELKLPHYENNLTFNFIGISLTAPEKVQYKYKLKGFDNDWSPISHKTSAPYINLPAGKYTFMVKASNSDGVWSEPVVYKNLIITPPFWKTWWFYTACGIVALAIIYIFIKIRERNLIKAQKRLSAQVKERTKELRDKNEVLSDAYEEIERKNKDVTDSIRYAKRLQNAILPRTDLILDSFPDAFVFYRPKEIVSGDFYWFFSASKNEKHIAAVDCTGHGVPGAFMSMMGNDLLNHIIIEKQVSEPAQILNELNEAVNTALKQTDKESEIEDGMDIALCSITKDKVTFAGALRPLYLVRNNKLKEIKGDAFPIGGYYRGKKSFSNQEIKIKKNDTIYLFSDGYADQFGGPNNKKFMTKHFKRLLQDIQDKNMQEQKQFLEKSIDEWKGDEDQVDDMLIIGIKF